MQKLVILAENAAAGARAFLSRPAVEQKRIRTMKHGKAWGLGILRAVFIIGFCFVILYPVISMLSKAVMQEADLYDNAVIWVPKHFTLKNLKFAWTNMEYPKSFLTLCGCPP